MALNDRQAPVCDRAINLLLRTQNPDGSWPAFEGDDPEGCWTTALAAIALRFMRYPSAPLQKALRWLLKYEGREGHWFWKWKFRTVDRAVQFNPEKYGWPWFPGIVHQDEAVKHCIGNLHRALSSRNAFANIETLSLATIAISVAQGNPNPFSSGDLK